MIKDNLRVRLLQPNEIEKGKLYMVFGDGQTMSPGQIEYLNEDDNTWYSLPIYVSELPKIISG